MEKPNTYPYERRSDDSSDDLDISSQSTLLDNWKENTFRRRAVSWRRSMLPFLVHILLVCLYLAWTYVLLHADTQIREVKVNVSPGPDLVYSPAREAVEYETVLMNNSLFLDEGPFKGPPREEQTKAWDDILMWAGVRVEQEDLDQINHHTAVKLTDGGYLVMLDSFHQIHCLDIIRRWIHRDYYEIKDSPTMAIRHVDHCLDSLRRIAMCHGDIEMVTFDWVESQPFPFPNFLVNRECRNWDKIMQWAKDHHAEEDHIVRPSNIPYVPQEAVTPSITLPGKTGGTHW